MKKWWATVAALLAAVPLAAGCGSSAGSAEDGGEIPVGVVGSYTGPDASNLGVSKLTVQAWADSVNAAGGINGRRVHLYLEDDGGAAQAGVTAVKRLVEQDHVVALVGQAASSSNDAWAKYVESKGIPVVGGVGNNLIYVTNPDFYAAGGNLVSMLYGVAKTARSNGPDLAVLFCAEISACAANPSLFGALGGPLGLKVAYQSKVAASSPDYTAVCQGIKASGSQSYFLGLSSAVLIKLVPQCVQQGVTARLVLPGVLDSTFPAKPAFNGVEMASTTYPFFDQSIPAAKRMHEIFAQYAPQVGTDRMPLNDNAVEAYISGKLFEAAVKAAGPGAVTPDSVKKGLYALHGETLGGLAPPLTFVPGKPNQHNCYFTFSLQNGRYAVAGGAQPTCADGAALAPIIAKLAG